MSRESLIEGYKLAYRACWQTRWYYLTEIPLEDTADLIKDLGIKKEHQSGAMALIKILRER